MVVCAGFLLMAAGAQAADWEFWNRYAVKGSLHERWDVTLFQEFRLKDDFGDFFLHQTEAAATFTAAHWLDLGMNYRQIYEKRGGEWKEENRPHLNAVLAWSWGEFFFKDRNRLEYRNREDPKDVWRYQNRLQVLLPAVKPGLTIVPYIAEEVFIVLDGEGFNQNRVYAVGSTALGEHVRVQAFYL